MNRVRVITKSSPCNFLRQNKVLGSKAIAHFFNRINKTLSQKEPSSRLLLHAQLRNRFEFSHTVQTLFSILTSIHSPSNHTHDRDPDTSHLLQHRRNVDWLKSIWVLFPFLVKASLTLKTVPTDSNAIFTKGNLLGPWAVPGIKVAYKRHCHSLLLSIPFRSVWIRLSF